MNKIVVIWVNVYEYIKVLISQYPLLIRIHTYFYGFADRLGNTILYLFDFQWILHLKMCLGILFQFSFF